MREDLISKDEKPVVLIVDDSEINGTILRKMVEKQGYEAVYCDSGIDALTYLKKNIPSLIVSDISMPEMDGYQLCGQIKQMPSAKDIPLIFISAMDTKEEKIRGFELGAADFITKPFELWEVTRRIQLQLDNYLMRKNLEQYNKRMHRLVKEQSLRIEQEHRSMLGIFTDLVEERDASASQHNEHVSYNSRLLAQAMQFSDKFEKQINAEFIDNIEMASKTHDIGKLFVPDEVLFKPGALTEEEILIAQGHCEKGASMLERLNEVAKNEKVFLMAIEVARHHHERWDGNGYPDGLKAEDIPLAARIVAVTGTFDTLTGPRIYRRSLTADEAFEIMEKDSGTQFDPNIFDVFKRIRRKLKCNDGE